VKFKGAHFWIAVLSLLAVLGVAVVDLERTSPGEITRVHAREEQIAGGQSCKQCHGGFFSSMSESCLECHEQIQTQLAEHKGLHGVLDSATANACATCHSEHHGTSFAIINRQSFALAGVSDPDNFDHRKIGWEMDGAHLELACASCHANADAALLPVGGVRYIGLDQNCASCHDDPHAGAMANSCVSCHSQNTWDQMHAKGHEQYLPLIGGHEPLDCRVCHAKDSERALEAMDRFGSAREARTCQECHDSPHSEKFTRGVVQLLEMRVDKSCVSCHEAQHEGFRSEALLTSQEHALSGFALDLPHNAQNCTECHNPAHEEFEQRYPGRKPEQCSQCHQDPHGGQFEQGPFSSGDCISCHERTQFAPHTFDIVKHARANFQLNGAHAASECNACHRDPVRRELPREFRGIAGECESCHANVHGDVFQETTALLPALKGGECARCHDTTRFADVPASHFDHGAWTGFEIGGSHAQSACESCHVPRAFPDFDGRSFGKVSEHFGAYQGCITCHQDPHQGAFDGAGYPKQVGGRFDCARCHETTSFRSKPYGFDHGTWAGFELLGGHRKAACSACHTPKIPPDPTGRTWEPALGRSCADCHDNPHGEQFALEGRTDCSACHAESVRSFSTFDHERDSRFPLGSTHKNVSCAQCHSADPSSVLQNGRAIVRYKPLDVDCASCHGVHEEVLLRRKPGIK
jgi:hypothetical protein